MQPDSWYAACFCCFNQCFPLATLDDAARLRTCCICFQEEESYWRGTEGTGNMTRGRVVTRGMFRETLLDRRISVVDSTTKPLTDQSWEEFIVKWQEISIDIIALSVNAASKQNLCVFLFAAMSLKCMSHDRSLNRLIVFECLSLRVYHFGWNHWKPGERVVNTPAFG